MQIVLSCLENSTYFLQPHCRQLSTQVLRHEGEFLIVLSLEAEISLKFGILAYLASSSYPSGRMFLRFSKGKLII